MSHTTTGISPKWKIMARSWLGVVSGRHCHWCKYMRAKDGEVVCGNAKSKYHDGERIRSWDGAFCARYCRQFALKEWYKSDANFDRYINRDNTRTMRRNHETRMHKARGQ